MANLTAEQKETLARWAAEGATLNDIQDRLKRELSLTLTYMETRLLVMELGLKLMEKPKEKPPEPESTTPPEEAMPEDAGELGEEEMMPPDSAPEGGGNVTLSLDQIAVPGTMVSGKATFSDGKTAGWYLDQYGRLGLRAPEPGYQPPAADIPVFQRELQRLLQKQGY